MLLAFFALGFFLLLWGIFFFAGGREGGRAVAAHQSGESWALCRWALGYGSWCSAFTAALHGAKETGTEVSLPSSAATGRAKANESGKTHLSCTPISLPALLMQAHAAFAGNLQKLTMLHLIH